MRSEMICPNLHPCSFKIAFHQNKSKTHFRPSLEATDFEKDNSDHNAKSPDSKMTMTTTFVDILPQHFLQPNFPKYNSKCRYDFCRFRMWGECSFSPLNSLERLPLNSYRTFQHVGRRFSLLSFFSLSEHPFLSVSVRVLSLWSTAQGCWGGEYFSSGSGAFPVALRCVGARYLCGVFRS